MVNADEADDYEEALLTPRCGYCRNPMIDQRKGAKYCGRRCKELAREKRKRDRERVADLRSKYPDADLSLAELYTRATPPRLVGNEDQGNEDNRLHPDEDQGDEGPGAWSGIWRLHEAEEAIRARYEARQQHEAPTYPKRPFTEG